MFRVLASLGLCFLILVGPGDRLRGEWVGEDAQGTRHVFVFEDDGRATWKVSNSSGLDATMEIDYEIDDSVAPHRFDLSGFEDGPLAGLKLFGILEFVDDRTLRFDVDAADAESDADEVRPKTFGERTLTLKRSP